MKAGDWVLDPSNHIAKVKRVHSDGSVDLVMYDHSGNQLGRTSPASGGPTTYEPCCEGSLWTVIKTPKFPLRMVWKPYPGRPDKMRARLSVEYA